MKNIIAISGCGFSITGTLTPIENYILSVANEPTPKICFLPTASGDAAGYVEKFYFAFKDSNCKASHLSLTTNNVTNIEDYLLSQNIIYVGGGNTAKMLSVWKEHGVDTILKKAWNEGVVLCGISAGAMCWFEGGITDSFASEFAELNDGLGILKGTYTPHCKSENGRLPLLIDSIKNGFKEGYGVDDDASLYFFDNEASKIISLTSNHKAYYITQNKIVTLEPDLILR